LDRTQKFFSPIELQTACDLNISEEICHDFPEIFFQFWIYTLAAAGIRR
jgi:hypothetical protein